MKVFCLFALWLWPLGLGIVSGVAWFLGLELGIIDWTAGRVAFAAAWVCVPILFAPGLRR